MSLVRIIDCVSAAHAAATMYNVQHVHCSLLTHTFTNHSDSTPVSVLLIHLNIVGFPSSGMKPRRDAKKGEFRDRVLLVLLFLVVLSLWIWFSRSNQLPSSAQPSSTGTPMPKQVDLVSKLLTFFMTGLEGVRQQTQEFIQQYKKQLSNDFSTLSHGNVQPATIPVLKTQSKQSIRRTPLISEAKDPNAVIHVDTGPLPMVHMDNQPNLFRFVS